MLIIKVNLKGYYYLIKDFYRIFFLNLYLMDSLLDNISQFFKNKSDYISELDENG